jgi:hypothetical protein
MMSFLSWTLVAAAALVFAGTAALGAAAEAHRAPDQP